MTKNKKPKSKSRSNNTKEKAQENKFPEKYVQPPYMRFLGFIHSFLNDAECAKDMFTTVIPALKEQDKKVMGKIKKTTNLLLKHARFEESRKSIAMHHVSDLVKYVEKLNRAETMFRGNALVGIVSRYDQFENRGVREQRERTEGSGLNIQHSCQILRPGPSNHVVSK